MTEQASLGLSIELNDSPLFVSGCQKLPVIKWPKNLPLVWMVRGVGIEPTLLAEADFEWDEILVNTR